MILAKLGHENILFPSNENSHLSLIYAYLISCLWFSTPTTRKCENEIHWNDLYNNSFNLGNLISVRDLSSYILVYPQSTFRGASGLSNVTRPS